MSVTNRRDGDQLLSVECGEVKRFDVYSISQRLPGDANTSSLP
jgi:hypothetical protein